ncbi:hypothetical protein [Actinoplanes subtropicus]|uniref:hypothetical protein n=1 Tax=Actinoplanes subtropicus TaxID=543632 RepID=UPI0004C3AD39|nr:hypothetical protein [Actinoplanes subtropicus]
MSRVLTLLDSGTVDLKTIDRVLQSVVFFADAVAVRASYKVAGLDKPRARQIDRRLTDLHEQKLISLWAHEYEVDDAGRVRAPFLPGSDRRTADVVVEAAGLAERLSEMNDMLRVSREEAYRRHPGRLLRQGVAEVVSLRNQLSSLVISAELGQDGLLGNPATRSILLQPSGADRPATFREAVAQEVVGRLRLGPLSMLTPDEIAVARRHNAGFRRLLDDSLLAVSQGMDPLITPEAAAQEIVNRYRETTTRMNLRSETGALAADVAFDVLGMVMPPSVLVKYALNAFTWRRRVKEAQPYLMLLHLERRLGQQALPPPR